MKEELTKEEVDKLIKFATMIVQYNVDYEDAKAELIEIIGEDRYEEL